MTREEILKSAKPILLNTDMVRAILYGRKTVTRRVVKPQPTYSISDGFSWKGSAYGTDLPPTLRGAAYNFQCAAPYQPGDILYVRETWTKEPSGYYYRADFDSDYLDPCETLSGGYPSECRYYPGCVGCTRTSSRIHWRPSIHMPKEAARIFLQVAGLRVERLQQITEDGARSEGIGEFYCGMGESGYAASSDSKAFYDSPIGAFANIWNSTIKKSDLDRYGWDANPWVWAIEFERVMVDENTN